MNTLTVRRLLPVLAIPVVVLMGCSSDDSSSTTTTTAKGSTTTTAASGSSTATVRFDKTAQADLAKVGCFSGPVDGVIGPRTDAAIVAFQAASGLATDGELGPETDAALRKAAAAGTKVCTGATTTTAEATTTTAAGRGAACTATAITPALPPGASLTHYVCADGWAAGSWTNGQIDGAFILRAEGGSWTKPAQDPCGSASAGVPPQILKDGCVS